MRKICLFLSLLNFFNANSQSLSIPKSDYSPNEEIPVSFAGFAGTQTDWIGISNAGSPDNQYITWQYTGGSTSGALKFTIQETGSYELRGYFNNGWVVVARVPIRIVSQAEKGWKVWVRTEPCSGRFDWLSVAKERGGGGTGKGMGAYVLYNMLLPTPAGLKPCIYDVIDGCTFEEANMLMTALRMHPKFFDLCCREYSVWRNELQGKNSVVLGDFSPGLGWSMIKNNLCCEEAEALAGIPGACSGSQGIANCFSSDPGMIASAWDEHYDWAMRQSDAALSENFLRKINLLFTCPAVPDAYLPVAYADLSVLIAEYVPDAACFGGDRGVIAADRNTHEAWARTKTRAEMLSNLQWKIASALKCLTHEDQSSLFSDNTIVIGEAIEEIPNVIAGGGGDDEDDPGKKDDEDDPGKKDDEEGTGKKDDNTRGEKPCDAGESSLFTQMTGTWQTSMGPKIVISGSCERASGNLYFAEYCENPDATYNTSLPRYQLSFTGRMSGSSLQIEWKRPDAPEPRHQQGTAFCSLDKEGMLNCSGFPCGVAGKRK